MKSSKILFLIWYPKSFGDLSFKHICDQPLVNQLEHHRELYSISLFMGKTDPAQKKQLRQHICRAQVHSALQVRLTISPSKTLRPALH